jgi:dipeptidyl aminopeptidase/acylaminoacyl peptidase
VARLSSAASVPYGAWPSPISAERVARASVLLSESLAVGDSTWWIEERPHEDGRYVVMSARPGSEAADVLPAPWSARTRVHEYGGGSYTVDGGVLFFTDDADQRLYRLEIGGDPVAITPEPPAPRAFRYADMDVSADGSTIACVRERHGEGELPENDLVALPADGSADPEVIASGRDFYAFPRWSPDGLRLAFIEWDFPRMPWDETELVVADVSEGRTAASRPVAGGPSESIFQPAWGPDGRLHFISDRTGWWNLYRHGEDGQPTSLAPMEAEFGVPMWMFGYSTYAFLADGRIACLYRRQGVQHLAILDPATGELLDLDVPFTSFEPYLRSSGDRLVFIAGAAAIPHQVVELDLSTRAIETVRESDPVELDGAYFAEPRPIEFLSAGGRRAYAFYYPPTNPDVVAGDDERPPLLVRVHGGPTSEVTPEFDLGKQFFTSRGFAYVDVNYGGSTGYGRAFRESLYGQWGIVDVEDAEAAARYLVDQGLADPERLLIHGGSAGGWTTLCALTFGDTFATGASYYGVSDLEPFATFTHKFEFRYNDVLVGPWPEAADLWAERSPVRHTDRLDRPLLILQGDEDEVVPPSQADLIVEALESRGLPYAYLLFEGEQHGFRKAENIQRSLEAELTFYGAIVGFEPADELPPLDIRNLP